MKDSVAVLSHNHIAAAVLALSENNGDGRQYGAFGPGGVTLEAYQRLKERVISAGYAKEIAWADKVAHCDSPADFLTEYIWVVLNSGIKNQIAERIFKKVIDALKAGRPVRSVFGHPGKAAAITRMCTEATRRFREYQKAPDKLAYLETLPWIGRITKYHLARNLGLDVCKPDRHLFRIAYSHGMTPHTLCTLLASESGDRIGTVDVVLWRAANLGMI